MSFDSNWAIEVNRVSKCYKIFKDPKDRLKEFFMPRVHRWFGFLGQSSYSQQFWSLRDVSFQLSRGEVLGLIGVNGAGKSSLLQLICGVLEPSSGEVFVNGRVAALLELGAGFNPEFTGRENIALNATLLGLSPKEIEDKTPEIIAFSGIEAFIDQPVKTYSSGMYVRLAFSIATSVDPDILVIDEALSVGDGAFARKSFDRIMELKAKGVTILFCSHSIYQVEALCQKAIWLHQGQVQAMGPAREVALAYNHFLDRLSDGETDASSLGQEFAKGGTRFDDSGHSLQRVGASQEKSDVEEAWDKAKLKESPFEERETLQGNGFGAGEHTARLKHIKVLVDGQDAHPRILTSMSSNLEIQVQFAASLSLATPNVGVVITDASGKNITSCSNFYDGVELVRDANGWGEACVLFPRIHLLRGRFVINVFLLCENAILIYDSALVGDFEVIQPGLELGVVALQREWRTQWGK